MKFLDKIFLNKEEDCFRYRLVLDIGTEYLKAALVEYNREERNIIAFSRVKQDYGNMVGGAITNIAGVLEKAREALLKIKEFSPHQTKEMVCGIAGEFVKGVLLSLDISREKADRRIDEREVLYLIREGEKRAYEKALKMAEMETGIKDVQMELIQTNIVEIKVDGYKVIDPYQFQGKNLNLIVFYSFVPLVQLGALHTVASKLGYELVAVVPEPMAVAEGILNAESREFGAVIIDIGGGTTDIALIRNGGIEGTRMFAMGGRAFTRTIAGELNLSLKEAEELKLAYSRGEKVKDFDKIDKLIKADLHIIYQGIELSLMELAQGEVLPKRIYFCGGGSALRGLISGFRELNPAKRLPFGQNPLLKLLSGKDIKGIQDQYSLLTGVEYTTPRALAYCASKSLWAERRMMNLESQRL
ncbi:MAG TPA: cell division protein FtsA [Halanaerobiaceae bacterium]|nr:cell division FtsA domain-containing protein [Bacillota bacterium]HHU92831.1 cell division protein FtsA [Halanaerobiaceae bacterium]HOA40686.1 cell division FtsA domain-containing protein [Halanaerobiales bacterium]HPZ63050.1 cell division FtsA domain-containing protein [Halanaerobiales bacterium]HQD04528.1 cell division FtsA domain-containing protein [Halanaerobiales bacterium]